MFGTLTKLLILLMVIKRSYKLLHVVTRPHIVYGYMPIVIESLLHRGQKPKVKKDVPPPSNMLKRKPMIAESDSEDDYPLPPV